MRIAILGGGIVGVTTAYFLAKAGVQVTVIERNPGVAMQTSFANAGLISPGHSYTWASPQAPAILAKSLFYKDQALKLKLVPDWRMYAWCLKFIQNCTAAKARTNTSRKARLSLYSQSIIQEVTGREKLEYDRVSKGLLYLHREDTSLQRAIRNMGVLEDNGVPLRVLSPAEVGQYEPALTDYTKHISGALYCPSDESGDARVFTKAMYECCVAMGVRFMFDTVATNASVEGDRIKFIQTCKGPIDADRFVFAMGCDTSRFARKLGYRLPIYPVKGYSVTFPILDPERAPDVGGLDEHHLIAWARFGSTLRVTGTAEFAGYDTTHKPSDFSHMIDVAKLMFPDAIDFTRPSYWAGLRPMTPDGTPILGPSRHKNLFFNAGHGHLGWTWSCGTARIVSDLIIGKTPEVSLDGLTLR
ncbi:D-amino acid dehydrogenase [Paraburkholderia sp. BCC1885]|uniref:D-amino acid dehydrogenase n=1 Tax=Paraburkholderia sp. BCC1885 TaxID=2562669 RepID=UPI001183C6E9|nr:D-amino acid dehydrogenase [Paraburkholderia sp. BCC1885]